MTEILTLSDKATKEERYLEILPQIESIITGETNLIANLANICALLNAGFGHLWTGFYLRDNETLVLGPFQGPLACTRIPLSPVPRGVCGISANQKKTIIVEDVEKFSGHIACSSLSKSEIVIPLVVNNQTELVLDIDSNSLNSFDKTDSFYLEKIIILVHKQHFS